MKKKKEEDFRRKKLGQATLLVLSTSLGSSQDLVVVVRGQKAYAVLLRFLEAARSGPAERNDTLLTLDEP